MRVKALQAVGPDLATRNGCDRMFDSFERSTDKRIYIDFSGVSSISRSFAHQYVLRKNLSIKTITELSVPATVKKMMSFVQHEPTKKPISYSSIESEVILTSQ